MSFIYYLKEKWYMFIISVIAVLFAIAIFLLDRDAVFGNSNTIYIFSAIILFFILFVVIDFLAYRSRVKKLSSFIKNGGIGEYESFFPSDRLYSDQVSDIANEYNIFRSQTAEESAEEMDFITKWVHDVKVPISAMKLLLENDVDDLKDRLDMELLSIEQDTQKVLFHIKSKSFYDDYKIAEASTQSIINSSLKQFATFFAYKKINLKITGGDYSVLTDSKWSGYIVSQFISNAIKHTDDNGEISINTIKDKNSISISVRNTGLGIEVRDIQSVFIRGYTASSRQNQSSTGYGLYLSKTLSDKLGHEVRVESVYGKYAKFSLIFRNS